MLCSQLALGPAGRQALIDSAVHRGALIALRLIQARRRCAPATRHEVGAITQHLVKWVDWIWEKLRNLGDISQQQ